LAGEPPEQVGVLHVDNLLELLQLDAIQFLQVRRRLRMRREADEEACTVSSSFDDYKLRVVAGRSPSRQA
jgi:hypothetical protein